MNEKDYQDLFNRYFQPLYGYALKFVADEPVCEEIVMDVLLRVWQKKHLLAGDLPLASYLFRSVKNGIIDHLRKHAPDTVPLGSRLAEPVSSYPADGLVLYKELEGQYRIGLEQLPPQKKLIFSMSREGESYQQIADKLCISKNTVENHMVAALRLMRTCLLVFLSLAFLPAFAQEKSPDSFQYLKGNFSDPGAHYGSAPLWVWNTKVKRSDIDSMLYAFKKNAFGGVFIHPRPGLITEYLSQEWFDDYAYAVKKGKELGLDVWIYDEDSYPSGFAGGHVPDEMPASFNQGQMLHLTKMPMLPGEADKYFRCLLEENGAFTDITGQWKDHQGKAGRYYLFNKEFYYKSPWYGGFSYVDLMVKGVTEKFIDVTMRGYEKSIGGEFGKTVRGIFSDEANIESQGEGNIRWTPDLFSTFQQKWGYDLTPHLPSLFEEVGDWKKVRHNYYQTLLDLFVDRWSKPFAAYAEKKHLEWTGHYWEHAWPNPSTGPDNMAMYVWPQRPGIDMLFNQFNEVSVNAQFGNIRSVRELASVSNQLGKQRNLSETYGGGGWDLSFKDMKRLGDWEFVLGVNTLNQHLSYMTINGARKYDYPQSFSYHEPWWPYYAELNRHFTRLTFAMTRGQEQNKILVIEPTTSAWMYFNYDKPDKRFGEIGQNFQAFVTRLQKAQVEYDLGSEYIIKERGSVTDGKFIVGQRSYSTVVIPPGMENIDRATFGLLQRYVAAGGRVLQFEKLAEVDGGEDKLTGSFNEAGEHKVDLDQLNDAVIDKYFRGHGFSIDPLSGDSIGGDLYHQRRQLADGQLLFLANSDMVSTARARVSMKGKSVLQLNTMTGKITEYPAHAEGENVVFDCVAPPAGSLLLFVTGKGTDRPGNAGMATGAVEGRVIPAGLTRVLRPRQNELMIDFCDLRIGDTLLRDWHVYYAADTVFKHFGFGDGNPWNHSVQFRRNIVDRDTFSVGKGFAVTYHFRVDGGLDTENLEAVVERPAQWKITVNGQVVRPEPGKWWLDRSFAVLSIGRLVHAGENSLQLSTDKMSVYDEVEPVYLLGDFNLISAQKGWSLGPATALAIGSWKQQGMPMYGHGVRYVKEFEWKAQAGRLAVKLGKWNGTVAAVSVNGRHAGIIAFDPYELDITAFVKPGKNKVEIEVIGSLKNLLGPHHSSKPGLASPWDWRNTNVYPPGKDYETFDYGLMEDFKLTGS